VSPRRSLIALALVLPSLVSVAIAPPASAKAVAVADTFKVYDATRRSLDVLSNDYDDAILFPKSVYVCGLSVGTKAANKIHVYTEGEEPTRIQLLTAPDVTGTVTFTYQACRVGETSNASRATVTLKIRALKNLQVKRGKHKGKVRVINPNGTLVGIVWSIGDNPKPRGMRTLKANQKMTLNIKRSKIFWAALGADGDGVAHAGSGQVRGIMSPR